MMIAFGVRPATENAASSASRSARTPSTPVPAEVIGVPALVIDAGLTPATAAFAGSMKSMSSRARSASASDCRTRRSADGLLKRTSSSVSTAMFATFAKPKVREVKSKLVSGFGAPSPTQ